MPLHSRRRCSQRKRSAAHLALCRPDIRRRSGRPIGPGDLYLLQTLRLRDGTDGRELRNVDEILELVGCDLLKISPQLMKELSKAHEPIERKLSPQAAKKATVERLKLDKKKFRYLMNDDAMATEKTAEGIRKFAADIAKLEKFIAMEIGA